MSEEKREKNLIDYAFGAGGLTFFILFCILKSVFGVLDSKISSYKGIEDISIIFILIIIYTWYFVKGYISEKWRED